MSSLRDEAHDGWLLYNSRWKFHQLAARQLLGQTVRYAEKAGCMARQSRTKSHLPVAPPTFQSNSGPEFEEDALAKTTLSCLLTFTISTVTFWSVPEYCVLFHYLLFFFIRGQLHQHQFVYNPIPTTYSTVHDCLQTIPPVLIRPEAEYFKINLIFRRRHEF
jgi:hypothetical protein